MASNSSTPSLDPTYKWLQHVDEHVSPDEGVPFLKLALYPFLRNTEYTAVQELNTPMEIYNFISKKCFQRDKKKTLQWFSHALGLLGGDLRGTYLVDEDCLSTFGISLPHAPSKMNPELRFFECITKIATKARRYNLEEELKERFSRKRYLNMNPRHLKHLPDLFIRLVQKQLMSPTNTYHLVKILKKIGSNKAKQCLICLNEYHLSVGLDEIKEVRGVDKEPQTDVFDNTDTPSSDNGAGKPRRVVDRIRYHWNPDKYNRQDGRGGEVDDASLRTLVDHTPVKGELSSASDASDSEHSSDDTTTIDDQLISEQPQVTVPVSHSHYRQRAGLCCCWSSAIVVTLVLAGVLCGTVWKNLFTMPKFDDVFVIDKTAVVVAEVDNYYHSELNLIPWNGVPLRDSVVEIYRFDSSCDHAPTRYNVSHFEKFNITGNQNYTRQYLLPGSTLNYTIAPIIIDRDPDEAMGALHNSSDTRRHQSNVNGYQRYAHRTGSTLTNTMVSQSTESNREATDVNTVPLLNYERIQGYVYITRGPERREFDSSECQDSSDCTILYHKPFYDSNSYSIKERGYYNFHTAHVLPQNRYSLNLTVNARTVDLNRASHVCNISDINEDENSCSIKLQFKTGRACFVAYAQYVGADGYVVLNVEVTKQLKWVLATSVTPTVFLLLVMYVCLILLTIFRRKPSS